MIAWLPYHRLRRWVSVEVVLKLRMSQVAFFWYGIVLYYLENKLTNY